MIDLKLIDELSRKLSESLPPGLAQLRDETSEQFRGVLRRAFERMNLVTREEFDAQSAVLVRTREKLESLQRQIQELEREKG
ncbi:MAG TPA: accessory factor UbiK family protein [Xanthomonadales bacterium]|nr:accessory factor UbiK family protein [Xanthomonadales bacterium]